MDILIPTLPFIVWLQSFPFLKWPMMLFSALGSTYLYLLALPLLYWCVNRRIGLDLGFLILANVILNNLIKVLFALPRPFWVSSAVHQWAHESSFGLPSSHAQSAILFWLFLALQLPSKRRPWAIAGALLISGFIGLSRIYLAAHFPADVIVGYAMGLLVLGIYLRYEKTFRSWFYLQKIIQKIALATLGISMALIFFTISIHLHHGQMFPPFDAKAFTAINVISYTGVIFGLVIGMAYRQPDATIPRNAIMLLLRAIVGLAVLIVLWFALAQLTMRNGIIATLALRFCFCAIAGWWIACGAPWLFRLGETSYCKRIKV